MMGDTLTVVFTCAKVDVTKLNRKSLRALGKSGHHNVPGKNQEVA